MKALAEAASLQPTSTIHDEEVQWKAVHKLGLHVPSLQGLQASVRGRFVNAWYTEGRYMYSLTGWTSLTRAESTPTPAMTTAHQHSSAMRHACIVFRNSMLGHQSSSLTPYCFNLLVPPAPRMNCYKPHTAYQLLLASWVGNPLRKCRANQHACFGRSFKNCRSRQHISQSINQSIFVSHLSVSPTSLCVPPSRRLCGCAAASNAPRCHSVCLVRHEPTTRTRTALQIPQPAVSSSNPIVRGRSV